MQANIATFLRCPLSGEELQLLIVEEFLHPKTRVREVKSGVLWANVGGCYPIVNGIPRMLPESFVTYSTQLTNWWTGFETKKRQIELDYGTIVRVSEKRNKKIQSTFGFEWGLLKKSDQLKIWDLDASAFKTQLLTELQLPEGYQCKIALDAGCGHGRSARNMTAFSDMVLGAEVSSAVEMAYEQNDQPNCHFLQADVYFLPFATSSFDLVYSSGVLHHNPDTQKAFQQVAKLVKPAGIISIWLYHYFPNLLHNSMRVARNFTKHLPVQVVYWMNMFTLTPIHWVVSQLMGKKKKVTEISIELLDMLTPAYRYEHTTDEAKEWMMQEGFDHILVTDTNQFGFSIKAQNNQ
jgi:SAM-dependent methyltransferase/uncharacterized protein YbaR (Trm112 family)